MDYYLDVLKKYAVFSGRARRKEYWMFALMNLIIISILGALEYFAGLKPKGGGQGIITGLYDLAIFLPTIGVGIRRLHDTNKSGWWMLINIVPVIGWIVFFVYTIREGDAGTNNYGQDPKNSVVVR